MCDVLQLSFDTLKKKKLFCKKLNENKNAGREFYII